jgi:hypothetical protein
MAAKKTDSFKIFEANLERSKAFLRLFDQDRGVGQPTNDEKELLRGSLVFAVGALDAYLGDLILEIVPKYAPQSSQLSEALKAIAKADPGLSLRVALAGSAADSRKEFREALDEWLSTKSFHGPSGVSAALGYVACPITWDDFDTAAGEDSAKRLDKITKERHQIIHRGKRPYIVRNSAGDANELVAGIAGCVDEALCKLY